MLTLQISEVVCVDTNSVYRGEKFDARRLVFHPSFNAILKNGNHIGPVP